MTSGAYGFYHSECIETIDRFVKRCNRNSTVLFYCSPEYSKVRNLYGISNRLIKNSEKALANPQKYIDYVSFLQNNEGHVREILYKFKVKSKKIPFKFGLRNLLVENANTLNKYVDSLMKIDVEVLWKEAASMAKIKSQRKSSLLLKLNIGFYIIALSVLLALTLCKIIPVFVLIIGIILVLSFGSTAISEYISWRRKTC